MLSERIVDKLIAGDIEFMERFSTEQMEYLVREVSVSPYRDNMLFNSFKELARKYPTYAFKMTFDLPEYRDYWLRTLRNDCSILLDYKFLLFFLLSGSWAVHFVSDYLNKIVLENKDSLFAIIRHAERTNDFRIINQLKNHWNMEIRALFIIEILNAFPHMFSLIYEDDILDYFVKVDNNGEFIELMKEEYVSKIASLCLLHLSDEISYLRIRKFILDKYSSNTLAAELDKYGKLVEEVNPLNKSYIINDIDTLFKTSKNYKYMLFKKYGSYLDRKLYYDFEERIRPFIDIDDEMIMDIFINGLGDKFLEYVDKYLSLSTGAKVITDVGRGSCTRTFRIGDYVIKCSNKKWSYEESICPDSYLVLKNLEEDIVRNKKGEVTGAVEVQKYLSRPLLSTEWQSIFNFQKAFKEAGYYIKDRLVDEEYGPNCRHLDDYMDADCDNPDNLPEWFKDDPVVLVDRDLVFSLNNREPKIKAVNI